MKCSEFEIMIDVWPIIQPNEVFGTLITIALIEIRFVNLASNALEVLRNCQWNVSEFHDYLPFCFQTADFDVFHHA